MNMISLVATEPKAYLRQYQAFLKAEQQVQAYLNDFDSSYFASFYHIIIHIYNLSKIYSIYEVTEKSEILSQSIVQVFTTHVTSRETIQLWI